MLLLGASCAPERDPQLLVRFDGFSMFSCEILALLVPPYPVDAKRDDRGEYDSSTLADAV
jgi:hypothetical protein